MHSHLLALALAGASCAGCTAPATETTLPPDNPANPAAASVPFVRPVDVLAIGDMPVTALPANAMRMPARSMPGMDGGAMPGMTMPAPTQ